jgi:glycosyltransferase involved in cell wall biosynthesis
VAEHHPALTVGLMVYNEEQHMAAAIESVLRQDFSDYEIIIADNASEDKTGEIASAYANRDARIRYVRHARNMGALNNFNYLVRAAAGSYFVLAGGHDLWSTNFLASLKAALDDDPAAVIAYARTLWIDEAGAALKKRTGFIDTSGRDVVSRFNLTLWNDQNAIYGIHRRSALLNTRLAVDVMGWAAVLLAELAVQGTFIVVPEATWYRRVNRAPETRIAKLRRYHNILFLRPRPIFLPHWAMPWGYVTAVLRSRVSLRERLLLLISALSSLIRYGPMMAWDVAYLFLHVPPLSWFPARNRTQRPKDDDS